MKKIVILALLLCSTTIAAQKKARPKTAEKLPVETVVRQVNDRRSNGHFAQLAISVELPKILASEVTASRVLVTSAVDDSGRSLVDPEAQEPALELNQRGSLEMQEGKPLPVAVSVTLKNPDRKATKVKEVQGAIELYMPSKDPNSVAEVPKFLSFSGKALKHKALAANGVEIALVSPAQVEAEKKKRAAAKQKEYAEMGFSGTELEDMMKSFLDSILGAEENDIYVRIKDPGNHIQHIQYVDGAGEVKHLSTRDDEGMTLVSTWAGKPQPDWKLRVSMTTEKNVVRYAFVLKDVALP